MIRSVSQVIGYRNSLGCGIRLAFSTVSEGSKYSEDFKTYLKLDDGKVGSFFHDIPLNLNKSRETGNGRSENPRWSKAKYEVHKGSSFNPITQDSKNGQPRFVKNLFPYKGDIHN